MSIKTQLQDNRVTVNNLQLNRELLELALWSYHRCITFSSQVWRQGKGDFFLGCLLMAEVSTPFVCLGKILIQVRGH